MNLERVLLFCSSIIFTLFIFIFKTRDDVLLARLDGYLIDSNYLVNKDDVVEKMIRKIIRFLVGGYSDNITLHTLKSDQFYTQSRLQDTSNTTIYELNKNIVDLKMTNENLIKQLDYEKQKNINTKTVDLKNKKIISIIKAECGDRFQNFDFYTTMLTSEDKKFILQFVFAKKGIELIDTFLSENVLNRNNVDFLDFISIFL